MEDKNIGWTMIAHINTGVNAPHTVRYSMKYRGHELTATMIAGSEGYYEIAGYNKKFSNQDDLFEFANNNPVVNFMQDNTHFITKKAIKKHIEMLKKAVENLKEGRLIDGSYNTAMHKIEKIEEYITRY